MNAAVFGDEYPIGSYVPDSRARDTESGARGVPVSSRELTIVQEMLSTVNTLTAAGQRHTMGKVVGFISGAIEGLGPAVSVRNRLTLTDLLSQLARESERRSPDPQLFCWSADGLLELLSDLV
jgi:hypothetical protein